MAGSANRLKEIFLEALDLPPAERAGWLARACGEDAALRRQAEAMLQAHAAQDSFLEKPAVALEEIATATPGTARQAGGSSGASADVPEVPGYEILGLLGEGGMGVVYQAKHLGLDRPVALKYVHGHLAAGSAAAARFAHEARITAGLQHPGIPPVYEVGAMPDGRPFMAMKLIQGRDLQSLLRERGPGAGEWLGVFEAICQAVGYAHSKGVIHRDLKPLNVMVGAFGEVQVMDWGLAKVLRSRPAASAAAEPHPTETLQEDEWPATVPPTAEVGIQPATDQTRQGSVMGTPAYMPPEQALGEVEKMDRRSDVFGLGAILCVMLTGRPPFVGADAAATRRLAARADLADAFARLDACDADAELVALAKRCLAPQQDDRPADAGDLAQRVGALRRQAEERARLAEVDRARAAIRREELRRRQRLRRGAVAALVAVLLAGMAGTTVGMFRAERAAEKERTAAEHEKEANRLAQAETEKAERSAETEKAAKKAAEQERDAKEQALRQEKKAHADSLAILGFVRDDFLALTSVEGQNRFGGGSGTLGKDATLRQLLDLAAGKLDGRKDLDPLVEAELRWIIGVNYRGLGEYGRAVASLERCVKLRSETQSDSHPDTLKARNSLAVAYLADGKHPQALELLERVSAAMAKTHGPNHEATLIALNNLASAYEDAGRLIRAIEVYQRVRDAQEKTLGPDHSDTLVTLNNLASAYQQTARLTQAVEIYERIRDARQKTLPLDHPHTLVALNNLALAYREAGRLPEAIELLERAHGVMEKKLGADHPDTLTALTNLGSAYSGAGRLPEAIERLQRSLAGKEKILPPDHPSTLTTMANLAYAYRAARKLPRAIALYEHARDARVKTQGPEHHETLTTTHHLAATYLDAGDLEKGLPLLEQAAGGIEKMGFVHHYARSIIPETVAAYERVGKLDRAEAWQRKWAAHVKEKAGAGSPAHGYELALLGQNLLFQKKWADAETPLRECLLIREKNSPDAWTTFNARSMLGGALLEQKKYDEAEPLLLEGFEGMKRREKSIPPQARARLIAAIDRLIALYAALDRPDKLLCKWQSERARLARREEPKQPDKK